MIAVLVPALMPEPSTATTVTSVSPIISAAAVDAVRPGLRTALAPASSPATPPARRAGQPTTRASGLTSRGASSAMPANSAEHAAAEQQRHDGGADAAGEHAGRDRGQRARPTTPTPVLAECAAKRDCGSVRALADRRDRRHAGRAPRRQDAREQRDAGAEEQRDDDRARRDDRAGLGQLDAQRANRATMPLAIPRPDDEPDHRGDAGRSRGPRARPSA